MRTWIGICAGLCLIAAGHSLPAEATIITITGDLLIQAGDVYAEPDTLHVFDTPPDQTTITMTGGYVDEMWMRDSSKLDFTGGYIVDLLFYDSSSGFLNGEDVFSVFAFGGSGVLFAGGRAAVIGAEEHSSVDIADGYIYGHVYSAGDATLNLSGGDFDCPLQALGSSIVNLFGYGFNFDPHGYDPSDPNSPGIITGFWGDGTPFSLVLSDDATYDHIRLLPEPATGLLSLLLLTVGTLRRRRVTQ